MRGHSEKHPDPGIEFIRQLDRTLIGLNRLSKPAAARLLPTVGYQRVFDILQRGQYHLLILGQALLFVRILPWIVARMRAAPKLGQLRVGPMDQKRLEPRGRSASQLLWRPSVPVRDNLDGIGLKRTRNSWVSCGGLISPTNWTVGSITSVSITCSKQKSEKSHPEISCPIGRYHVRVSPSGREVGSQRALSRGCHSGEPSTVCIPRRGL